MIDLTVDETALEAVAAHTRDRRVRIPTLAQMRDPGLIPSDVQARLVDIGLWDLHPLNLYRITWHNEPVATGVGSGRQLRRMAVRSHRHRRPDRVADRQVVSDRCTQGGSRLWVPGSPPGHRPVRPGHPEGGVALHRELLPGGAYDSNLLGCESVAILPEGMSRERFEWLQTVAGEIIKTPGSESNVKEIFDKCNELAASGEDLMIFNQFDEFGNYLWHVSVTGPAVEEVLIEVMGERDRFRGFAVTTGSAGTIAAGDYLKQRFPGSVIAGGEAIQCPTMLLNGFGEHRIEGIGDKHIPWVHNVKNADFAIGLDDEAAMSLTRLFNEPPGQEYLVSQGVDPAVLESLPLLGISGAANLLAAIKLAKYYEMTSRDVVVTIATDSMDMYRSRLHELSEDRGTFTTHDAVAAYHRHLLGASTEHVHELGYYDRKRIHNLKYYTWVEQQGKTYEEIQAQWYDDDYWTGIQALADPVDRLIEEFNNLTGLG